MRRLLLAAIVLAAAMSAQGAVKTETIEYKHGDLTLEGFLAYDDSVAGKRPGVLVVHEWDGLGGYVKTRAEQLAKLGYVAFAIDMYGKGVRAKDAKEATELSGALRKDRPLMRARARIGLEVLRQNPLCDQSRIAAIGYCFGGGVALELARSGAPLAGVVTFHGSLDTPQPEDAKKITAKVLVLTGADDPHVDAAQVAAFEDEMRKAGVDWQLVQYGGAVHSFTNPASGNDPKKGVAYNEKADHRSWEAMKQFFDEIFKK